ncbi:ring-cleaving dioxygenase [Lutibaculum baratangense]|nr:ring-cleaving dioxygenase [Lutibaculum baratangense]
MQLKGIHHLTAVTADAGANFAFYTRTLGMRLVKKTVNQDDVTAYHLFYGDGAGSPGSDITFFDFGLAARERRGSRTVTRTAFRVGSPESLAWWEKRFAEHGVARGGIVERHGRQVLDFEDFEGQRLSLVDDGGRYEAHPWDKSPVPAEHQIKGLGPITMTVPALDPTDVVVKELMFMRAAGTYPDPEAPEHMVQVFEMGEGGPAAELHVAVRPDLEPARPGAGGVHHVAFRSDDADYDGWAERLKETRVPSSGKIDRFYFRSLYFREPNGVLFEIATDGPGFDADEPAETMGERLALPPFLEPRRAEIEAGLKPLATG